MVVKQKNDSLKTKSLSALLMFVVGFAGFSILGAIVLVILVTLGILPVI